MWNVPDGVYEGLVCLGVAGFIMIAMAICGYAIVNAIEAIGEFKKWIRQVISRSSKHSELSVSSVSVPASR